MASGPLAFWFYQIDPTVLVWIYALVGFIPIMVVLLKTDHARLQSIGETSDTGCPDTRIEKLILVFGGSAGLTFGGHYWLLGTLVGQPWQALFLVYAALHLALSGFQTAALLGQVFLWKKQGELTGRIAWLKAHWGDRFGRRGCGYTTSASPFWWLYWLALTTRPRTIRGNIVGVLRDSLTLVDFVASLPATLTLSLIIRAAAGIWIIPTLRGVDRGD